MVFWKSLRSTNREALQLIQKAILMLLIWRTCMQLERLASQMIVSSLGVLLWRRGWRKVGSAWTKFSIEFLLKNHHLVHNEDKLQKEVTNRGPLYVFNFLYNLGVSSRQELKPT
ncbi:hypothetical protein P3L10_030247 [Capsicum annuum]